MFSKTLYYLGEYMAFCKFSTENRKSGDVVISSAFFVDYMPYAPESLTKVYLYGLNKCYENTDVDNTLQNFATELNMTEEDIKSAFYYWQEEGLVTILNLQPIEVRYLPIRPKKYQAKMFKEDRYSSFNKSIQEILDGRMITPFEYREYYLTMESLHIEADAMLMIAKFCVNQKGNNVGYNYILTIAKNWAYDGVHTAGDVEKKLCDIETLTSKVKDILVALKSKKMPSYEDRELYSKWTNVYGYDPLVLIAVAKKIKRGGILSLSNKIDEYRSLKLFSIEEIEEFENSKDELLDMAKITCQSLGVFYENLDPVVNTYILKWKQMGYSKEAIKLIANICFKKYIRNIEQMDEIVSKYYSKGLVSIDAINEYISGTLSVDKKIKSILEALSLSRQVTSWDRDFYHTWTYSWHFNKDIIDYAVYLANGKSQPMAYINKILANWKENDISNLEDAKKYVANTNSKFQKTADVSESKKEFITHSFSSEELNALFDNLDEVKLI